MKIFPAPSSPRSRSSQAWILATVRYIPTKVSRSGTPLPLMRPLSAMSSGCPAHAAPVHGHRPPDSELAGEPCPGFVRLHAERQPRPLRFSDLAAAFQPLLDDHPAGAALGVTAADRRPPQTLLPGGGHDRLVLGDVDRGADGEDGHGRHGHPP